VSECAERELWKLLSSGAALSPFISLHRQTETQRHRSQLLLSDKGTNCTVLHPSTHSLTHSLHLLACFLLLLVARSLAHYPHPKLTYLLTFSSSSLTHSPFTLQSYITLHHITSYKVNQQQIQPNQHSASSSYSIHSYHLLAHSNNNNTNTIINFNVKTALPGSTIRSLGQASQ